MKTGCLILAGGKNSRMGRQKSSLKINGMTFCNIWQRSLADTEKCLSQLTGLTVTGRFRFR